MARWFDSQQPTNWASVKNMQKARLEPTTLLQDVLPSWPVSILSAPLFHLFWLGRKANADEYVYVMLFVFRAKVAFHRRSANNIPCMILCVDLLFRAAAAAVDTVVDCMFIQKLTTAI